MIELFSIENGFEKHSCQLRTEPLFLPFNSFLLIAIAHSIHSFGFLSICSKFHSIGIAFVVLWFPHIADQWRICKIATSWCWMREGEREQANTKNFTYIIPSQNWMKTNTIACFHYVLLFALLGVFCQFSHSIHSYLRGYSCLPVMNWIALLCFDVISGFIFISMCWILFDFFLGVGIETRWHVELLK